MKSELSRKEMFVALVIVRMYHLNATRNHGKEYLESDGGIVRSIIRKMEGFVGGTSGFSEAVKRKRGGK